jgi:hypothetical protein
MLTCHGSFKQVVIARTIFKTQTCATVGLPAVKIAFEIGGKPAAHYYYERGLKCRYNRCPFCTMYQLVDVLGHHAFKCFSSRTKTTAKHNTLRDVLILLLLESWEGDVSREPSVAPGAYDVRDGAKQQSYKWDIGLYQVATYLVYLIDVSVAGVNAEGHTLPTATGHAARAREDSKIKHYTSGTTVPAEKIVPFVLELLGAWGPQAVEFVKRMAISKTESHSVEDPEYAKTLRRYVQRIAFTLQKGNALQLCEFGARLRAHAATPVTQVTGVMGVMDSLDNAIA